MSLIARAAPFAALLMIAGVPGCSMFGGGDEADPAAQPAVQVARPVPVEQLAGLEIGRTRDGIVLSAYGVAPGIGYSQPTLTPRRGGTLASDGYLDFDFVATPPDRGFGLGQGGNSKARLVRADRLLSTRLLRGVVGVRVHSATNGRQIDF